MPPKFEITKAEEGTTALAALLADGWEPFSVVSEPRFAGRYLAGQDGAQEWVSLYDYENVVWLRRVRS